LPFADLPPCKMSRMPSTNFPPVSLLFWFDCDKVALFPSMFWLPSGCALCAWPDLCFVSAFFARFLFPALWVNSTVVGQPSSAIVVKPAASPSSFSSPASDLMLSFAGVLCRLLEDGPHHFQYLKQYLLGFSPPPPLQQYGVPNFPGPTVHPLTDPENHPYHAPLFYSRFPGLASLGFFIGFRSLWSTCN